MWSFLKQFFFKKEVHLQCNEFGNDLKNFEIQIQSQPQACTEIPLMDLPDRVLENIFKYLNFNVQFELASMNERLNMLMENVWRNSEPQCFLELHEMMGNDDLSLTLKKTSRWLRKMTIPKFNINQWKIIKQHTYPKAEELSIYFCDDKNWNNVIPVVCDLFPNLKSLHIRLDGVKKFPDQDIIRLIALRSLEDLAISATVSIHCLQILYEKLRLKSLNISEIEGYSPWYSKRAFENFCALERFHTLGSWQILKPYILKFSNLKEIWGMASLATLPERRTAIGGRKFQMESKSSPSLKSQDKNNDLKAIFRHIFQYKSQNVTKIVLGEILSLTHMLKHTFINLRRLDILYQNMNDFTTADLFKCAPNVREIFFFACYNLKEQLVQQISKSTQIESFYVGMCTCEFEIISIDVNDIVKGRTVPLLFEFWAKFNGGNPSAYNKPHVECNFIGKSPLFQPCEIEWYADFDHYCIEFQ